MSIIVVLWSTANTHYRWLNYSGCDGYACEVSDRAAKLQKTFGETVRTERLARKLTQEQLAEKADLSLNFIGIVERGEQMASLDSIVRLAAAMKMSGSELLTRARI